MTSLLYLLIRAYRTIEWYIKQAKYENFKNYIPFHRKDSTLIILANGPSLKEDLNKVTQKNNKYDYCVMNAFCKSILFKELEPIYYVIADPLFFKKELRRKSEEEVFRLLNESVLWNMTLYIPFNFYPDFTKEKILVNEKIHIVPYHARHYEGINCLKEKIYKKGLSMPKIQNVLIPSIFNGINAGYKTIYLCGVDHTWTEDMRVDNHNRVCLINKHFYNDLNLKLEPWLKVNGQQYKMHEILRTLAIMFEGYHELQHYSIMNSCKIINFTDKSFIDAFERHG
jgi:hypothetical protein